MAIMGKSQIIHTDGEDIVVITRSDYEGLLARAGDEASEDAMTARIVAATEKSPAARMSRCRPPCGMRSRAASTHASISGKHFTLPFCIDYMH
jgi:hypothetical protein